MKKTNKGFSLVELIIVIAIMAILAGALAPALIKYINKSRISTDISNGQQIASGIQTALSNENAYDECKLTGTNKYSDFVDTTKNGSTFVKEFKAVVGDINGSIKSKKDVKGTAISDANRVYYVSVDPANNIVEVYAGGTTISHQVYPSTGGNWVEK